MKDILVGIITKGVAGSLVNNILARNLYDLVVSGNYYISGRLQLANILISGQPSDSIPIKTAIEVENDEFVDLRHICLALQNVKKYPGKQEGLFYGIPFSRDLKHPCSAVFLGSNGVGKTSLFAALEYAGMAQINTAKIRGYGRKIGQTPNVTGYLEMDQSEFLVHSGYKLSDAKIIVKTASEHLMVDGLGELGRMREPIVSEAFYCSEYDVMVLENCEQYSNFLLSQLGLESVDDCLQLLYFTGKCIFQKPEGERVSSEIMEDYYQLVEYMENGMRDIIEVWMKRITGVLHSLLDEYFVNDNDSLIISHHFNALRKDENLVELKLSDTDATIKRNYFEFEIMIASSCGDLDSDARECRIHPRAYLNTFKYKLFCVALKLAMSCVAKSIYNINFPFIIDDVFNASDFNSRIKLRQFMAELIHQHNDLMKKDAKYNLQIIFFTQDELIAEQVERGIELKCGIGNVIFGRIQDYHEMRNDALCRKHIYLNNKHPYQGIDYISVADEIR